MKHLISTAVFLVIGFMSISVFAQETVKYSSFLDNVLLYETIELYPDSTFKWTSEYDLQWSEYGTYKIKGSELILSYKEASKTELFEVDGPHLYRIKKNGRRIKKVKDKSVKGSGFLRYKHAYVIRKNS